MANNLFQQTIVPEKPRILAEERVYVYVPTATNDEAGIASFKRRDFNINDGQVSLIWPMQMDIEKLSNPLENVSRIKVLDDEFEQTGNIVTLVNPNTGDTYSSKTAEVKLKRTGRNAFARPDLVQLDTHDFVATQDEDGFVKYTVKVNNPLKEPSLIQVDTRDFKTEEKNIVRISWPLAHDRTSSQYTNGYGLVKIANNSEGYLKYSEDGLLEFDYDKAFASEKAAISPIYGGTVTSGFVDIDKYLVNSKATRNERGNVLLAITKDAVGLTNVANRTFASYTYEEFGEDMQHHFTDAFEQMVNAEVYNQKMRSIDNTFVRLSGKDKSLQDQIDTLKSVKLFLGYFSNPDVLKKEYPATEEYLACYARVLSTNTYWTVQHDETGGYIWIDTTYNKIDFIDYVETDPTKLKPNGIASIGSSMNWVSSDHVHPTDTTRLAANIFHATSIDVISDFDSAYTTHVDFNKNTTNDGYNPQRKLNIKYVTAAKGLINSRVKTNSPSKGIVDKYWSGTYGQYLESKDDAEPNTVFFIDDGENYTSEHHASTTELDKAGITIDYYDQNEKFIITTEAEVKSLIDVPVTLRKIGNRYRLTPIELVGDGRIVVTRKTDNGNTTIESKSYRSNSIISTDNLGNLEATYIHPESLLKAADNGIKNILPFDRILLSDSNNTVKTFHTGIVNNRLLVSDGNGGLKVNSFTQEGTFLLGGESGILEPFDITPDNFLVTNTSSEPEVLEAGRLLLSGEANTVTTFTTTTTNRPIVANTEGGIKELNLSPNRLIYTDTNGGMQAFPMSAADHGKYVGVDIYGNPALVPDNTPETLPIETQTTIPISDNQIGTKLVILNSAPTNFHEGYLYLY